MTTTKQQAQQSVASSRWSPSAVARDANHLDVFVTGNDGHVYTTWWDSSLPDWGSITLGGWKDIGGSFPVGGPVSAVARDANHLDVFIAGNDGHVYTTWWDSSLPDWGSITLGGWKDIGEIFVVFIAWHNLDFAQWQANFDEYFPQGYRVISLSIYGSTSSPLIAAVMVREAYPVPQYVRHGLDAAGYQAAFDQFAAQGFGPTIISATGSADSPLFAGVWQPMSPIPLTRFGVTAAELAQLYNSAKFDANGNLLASTTVPLSLDVYGDPGDRRYAVVLAPNPAMLAWNGDGTEESSSDYQTRFNAQVADRNRVFLVSPTGDGHYASVFRDDQIGEWQARHGMDAQQYQQAFNNLTAQGYFPIQVQGGGVGGGAQFAAVFTKTLQTTPRQFTVTGSPASFPNDPYDAAMEKTMKAFGVRHAALSLVKGTKLVLARGYTYAEPGYPLAQPLTPFRQASCSKTITAILIHQLLHEKKLTLDTTLQSVLDLKAPGGGAPVDANFAKITVGHLLDHIAGIPTDVADTTVLAAFPGAKLPITSDQLASWIAGQTLVAAPGTAAAWGYSNNGYILLGEIVAKLRGSSYIDALSQHLGAPLGLQHTRLGVGPLPAQPADEARYTALTMPIVPSVLDPAQPLVPWEYGSRNFEVTAPAGGISSAVVDMARILAAFSLMAADNPMLAPAEITAMMTAATATFTNTSGQVSGMRAHGWDAAAAEPNGGWYGQKGGLIFDAQSCLHLSTDDISMSVVWGHWPTGGDWYPDFPEVINTAKTQNWGSTDLFPTFGMPSLA
ncbi:MAG: serine hydrolase [Solirubrobacterales bacterium]|nr:serine hydrolase [Solirubrobacterales bacterium]